MTVLSTTAPPELIAVPASSVLAAARTSTRARCAAWLAAVEPPRSVAVMLPLFWRMLPSSDCSDTSAASPVDTEPPVAVRSPVMVMSFLERSVIDAAEDLVPAPASEVDVTAWLTVMLPSVERTSMVVAPAPVSDRPLKPLTVPIVRLPVLRNTKLAELVMLAASVRTSFGPVSAKLPCPISFRRSALMPEPASLVRPPLLVMDTRPPVAMPLSSDIPLLPPAISTTSPPLPPKP